MMGCSLSGRIVLDLATERPEAVRAVIGLPSSAFVAPSRDTEWLHAPHAHGGKVRAAAVSGLIARNGGRGSPA